jgi:hypothetical protein
MTETDLQNLLARVRAWPEEAQNELVAVANQIESELKGDYVATQDELQAIDAAIASLDAERWPISKRLQPTIPSASVRS